MGRLASQAPEIDGCVWLDSAPGVSVGDLVPAEITKVRQATDLEARPT